MPSSEHDGGIGELARQIMDAERVPPVGAPPPPAPPRRFVERAVVPLRRYALAAQIMLCCWVPLSVMAVALNLDQRSLVHRIQQNPTSVSYAEVQASDHRIDVGNGILLGFLAVTAIVFIAWLHRAYRNLDGLDAPRRFGTGWAIGGWFVPVLSLWRPKQVADDIWAANALDPSAPSRSSVTAPSSSALIWAWWLTWVASIVVVFFVSREDARSLDQLLQHNSLYLVRDVLLGVAAVLAVLVVRRVTAGQRAAVEALRAHRA